MERGKLKEKRSCSEENIFPLQFESNIYNFTLILSLIFFYHLAYAHPISTTNLVKLNFIAQIELMRDQTFLKKVQIYTLTCLIRIIIMKNLIEIKSRQLQKYSTIDPFLRGVSFQTLDDQNRLSKHPLPRRETNYQNNYHLANAVRQILEMKPRTAQKLTSKHSSKNHKTQTLIDHKPSLQMFTNNANKLKPKPIQSQDNEEQAPYKTSLSKQKRQISFLEIDNRLNANKPKTSKSSRALKRNWQKNNLEVLNSFQNMMQNHQQFEQPSKKVQEVSKTDDAECHIRITKRKTECELPATKLSIKNIDKLTVVEPRKSISKSKHYDRFFLNLPKHNSRPVKQFKEDCELVDLKSWKEKRSKKSVTEIKVPEFIKASLQVYQQEPIYLLEELQKRKRREDYAKKEQQVKLEQQNEIEIREVLKLQEEKQVEDRISQNQNLLTNKITLSEKQKKKHIIVDPPQQLPVHINIDPVPAEEKKVEKKVARARKREEQQQKINICGWEQEDPNLPQILYFKC